MIIIRTSCNDSAYESIEDAKSDFATWDCGEWDDVMYNDGSDIDYIEVDIDDPAQFDIYMMTTIFRDDGSIKLLGTPADIEEKLNQLMAHLISFNEVYNESVEAFGDDKFRAYMALVEAEKAGNPNLRRKKDNGFNPHNTHRFIFNAEGTHGEHVELKPTALSAWQFEKMGITHPCRVEIKKNIEAEYSSYTKPLTQERYENAGAISKLEREIAAMEAKLRLAKESLAERQAKQAQLIEREQNDIAVCKARLSKKLKELGL
ncbi:hypothetical protein [Pseudoalteromonas rubra]|uniref:hypothetical protein n=1 Tax=Pseudoalteromonas rubra TaxID=43658 RepID=UPI002DB596E2|nr:hypothetical protein [Pseudoalteromonas rubra]MEC4091615.1 hypothetical protein [Pseudoalteromonas rubra]